MRLIHLSDIHLSKANFHEFSHHYINSLISDLKYYHNSISVDLIIITGDLVDKGGHSLLELDRYNWPYR